MSTPIVDRIPVIDSDTHIVEPADLWTSRISVQKWGELVPHVRHVEGEDAWFFGGERYSAVAGPAMAGWKEFPPSHPPTLADADPATWDSRKRLARMDEYGIYAQVLYPNVGGFGSGRFLGLGEPELMLDCVRAYNDFLAEWASTDAKRLVPIMALPFWDVDACVTEMNRAFKAGHRGILFGSEPEFFGMPALADPAWNPLWAQAQDLGLSINFHIAAGDMSRLQSGYPGNGKQANYAKHCMTFQGDNLKAISEVIISGLCHRFPQLNFVSVESGVGWIPWALAGLDWHWKNSGCIQEHPEYDLLPSEYFKRQVYGCFWFETETAKAAIDIVGPDNFLYETDFPHPTSMSPGPASYADNPKEWIEREFEGWEVPKLRKVLHDNAARLYHLD